MTTPPIMSVTDELIAELERSVKSVWPDDDSAVLTLEAMIADLAGLKRDAERYRFIKNKQTFIWLVGDWFPSHESAWIDVDAAIDAAMTP